MFRIRRFFALLFGLLPTLGLAQSSAFEGPLQWPDPAPAAYWLTLADTGMCLARTPGRLATQTPFIGLQPCQGQVNNAEMTVPSQQVFEFAPAQFGRAVVPATSGIQWRITQTSECATFARGVVFGPPAVDMVRCELPNPANRDWAHIGVADQRVVLRRLNQFVFGIRNLAGDKCWTARGGREEAGTEMVWENCDGRRGQLFLFIKVDKLHDLANTAAADRAGWHSIPGTSGFDQPDRFRDLRGFSITAVDISAEPTLNDGGTTCARACRDNLQCAAFTWETRIFRAPICHLKSATNAPVSQPGSNSGMVRPGPA